MVNVARDVEGAQVAGFANVARNVNGVQMSIFVNIARSSDYPIGLVNIIGDGEMTVGLSYNEIGTSSINFRSGGRVLHGIVAVGYNDRAKKNGAVSFIGGIGGHVDVLPWFRMNGELTCENIWGGRSHRYAMKEGFALLPTFRFGRFDMIGGPSLNYMRSNDTEMFDVFPEYHMWEKRKTASGRRHPSLQQIFLGWQAGVQFVIK
jgi:hypothetical protein